MTYTVLPLPGRYQNVSQVGKHIYILLSSVMEQAYTGKCHHHAIPVASLYDRIIPD
jgi:hypothetical protein